MFVHPWPRAQSLLMKMTSAKLITCSTQQEKNRLSCYCVEKCCVVEYWRWSCQVIFTKTMLQRLVCLWVFLRLCVCVCVCVFMCVHAFVIVYVLKIKQFLNNVPIWSAQGNHTIKVWIKTSISNWPVPPPATHGSLYHAWYQNTTLLALQYNKSTGSLQGMKIQEVKSDKLQCTYWQRVED